MVTLLRKIKDWYRSLQLFVILDPSDNSVTISKKLFRSIQQEVEREEKASVFVFRISENSLFGFMVNPTNIDKPTQYCDIQYNGKYKCIGFETLNPSVGRILYEYGLKADNRYKLSVSTRYANGKTFFQINKPKEVK